MPKRNVVWIGLALVAALASFAWLQRLGSASRGGNELGPLADVYNFIQQQYVQRIDDPLRERIIDNAARGAVEALGDEHSQYFDVRAADAVRRTLQGHFTGVGIIIELNDGQLTVATPIEASPAFVAGIMPGDHIVHVDGLATAGWTLDEAKQRITGPEGSVVELSIRCRGGEKLLTFRLTRTKVFKNLVKGFRQDETSQGWDYIIHPRRAEGGCEQPEAGTSWNCPRPADAGPAIGYIRVLEFIKGDDESTMHQFAAAVERVRAFPGCRGLIIDLRDNGGGMLDQAVQMVDMFVASGPIISIRGAHRPDSVYNATAPGTIADLPLAVLINKDSASASEIVAGSLSDHGRAVLVGERSYGKGTMQELIDLPRNGGAAMLKLTTGYYFLPSGRNINRLEPPKDFGRAQEEGNLRGRGGIEPDVSVSLSQADQVALRGLRLQLDAMYPGGRGPTTRADRAATRPDLPVTTRSADQLAEDLLKLDRQLAAAIDIMGDPKRYRQLLVKAATTRADGR